MTILPARQEDSPPGSGYGDAYQLYLDAGWTPLPLAAGTKFPPLGDYTGEYRLTPDEKKYRRWSKLYADGNLSVVMPRGVIGIDIDEYEHFDGRKMKRKHGARTYRDHARRYGKLPATAWSSSRDDGISGIYFYLIPPDVKLVGVLKGGDVEVVQYHHRYGVVWPSVHPDTGARYEWRIEDPEIEVVHGLPVMDTLPWLPDAWVTALSAEKRDGGTGFDGPVDDWLDMLPDGRLPVMEAAWLRKKARGFQGGAGSRYDAMVRAVGRLVRSGAEGGRGIRDALGQLEAEYTAALDGEPNRRPESEFRRALQGAVEKFGAGGPETGK